MNPQKSAADLDPVLQRARMAFERAPLWAQRRFARDSPILYNIGKLFCSGRVGYLTALLLAIDSLTQECRQIKETVGAKVHLPQFVTPEELHMLTLEDVTNFSLHDGRFPRLEHLVDVLSSAERRMRAEHAAALLFADGYAVFSMGEG